MTLSYRDAVLRTPTTPEVDLETNTLEDYVHSFYEMSLQPGIGDQWIDQLFRDYWNDPYLAPKELYVIYNGVETLRDGEEHINFMVEKLQNKGDDVSKPESFTLDDVLLWLDGLTQEQMAYIGI